MRTRVDQTDIDQLNAYLELEMSHGPVLLPRFWWTALAFVVPFIMAGSSLVLLAFWQHSSRFSEPLIVQVASITGFGGLALASYFYWSLVSRK